MIIDETHEPGEIHAALHAELVREAGALRASFVSKLALIRNGLIQEAIDTGDNKVDTLAVHATFATAIADEALQHLTEFSSKLAALAPVEERPSDTTSPGLAN